MKFKIRTKLILNYLFLILISLSILVLAILWPLQKYYVNTVETELIKKGYLVSRIIQLELHDNEIRIDNSIKELGEEIDARITVIKNTGEVLGETHEIVSLMENHADRPEVKTALAGQIGKAIRYSSTLDTNHLYIALPLKEQGVVQAVIRLSLPILGIQETLGLFRVTLLIGFIIATLVAVALSILSARTFTKPIEEISNTAKKISQGNLEERIYVTSKDELALLGQSINNMTFALKGQINKITTNNQSLKAILNHMASGVLVIDRTGIIKVMNPQAEGFFGVKEKEVIGQPYHKVIRNYNLLENINEILSYDSWHTKAYEFSILYPQKLTLRAYATPIVFNEKIEQIVIVFHDITTLRQLEKIKTDFVANASHELRTPVASIKGFSETLLDGALEDREVSRRFVNIIDQEAGRLTRLIKDLLDLSKIEMKGQTIEKTSIDIKELLEGSINYLESQALEKDIDILLRVNEEIPKIQGNKEMLGLAFLNLIENGIKYTPSGGKIKIEAYQENENLLVAFTDTGMGIPQDELSRIFERFYRVDKARSQDIKGTGLGLSIVKHIVEEHRGNIKVQSEVGQGSRFTITLPALS